MIIVVGSGPAGRFASMKLAAAHKEVILVDKREEGPGGQCLHQGCMVVCALNEVARTLDSTRLFSRRGFVSGKLDISWPALISDLREVQRIITPILEEETKSAGVTLIKGAAKVSGKKVFIDDKEFEPDAIILATGTRPFIPDISGNDLNGIYTAHNILSMPDLPKEMVIVGGGVIAAEFAYIFSVFGVKVTIVIRSELLGDIPDILQKQARKDLSNVEILEDTDLIEINGENGTVTSVTVKTNGNKRIIPTTVCFFATGSVPVTDYISGITLNKNKIIKVSDLLETSVPGVYAAGDITGQTYLTPMARRQGRLVADIILGRIKDKADIESNKLSAIPQSVKLKYDLAWCEDSGHLGKGITTPGAAGSGTFWAVPERNTGICKVECDKSGKITGVVEASPVAGCATTYLGWLINTGVKVQDLEKLIEVHPSADILYMLIRFLDEERFRD